ncbi:putative AlkP superfamily pyrophosphatase or phosphodiesterase [Mesonia algae]|uniref:Putative AlkP superfamily pyrophosphatase or phosphodiesterase n=1 Tax=Mesonia algae TaxID=213248 RepID=A0A2W7IF17_9FLAO|nr:alkaline phosphatase PafA [Mesonia algae]PZW43705.1 putative AlkP superfamily pyrophosphatase or phosphodiesterase [Mesonia algae]
MKKITLLLVLTALFYQCKTSKLDQNNSLTDGIDSTSTNPLSQQPKLVVGVVVDQMRYDYLTRFWDHFREDGFKKLVGEGFTCNNNHYNYVPTYTGPGHASIYTGTSPKNHGIISNNWYDKFSNEYVYCAQDDTRETIGAETTAGQMSPWRMQTTTVSDQNRLHTQFRGKTIGVALKDRGAILPAGHTANAAYWFYGKDKGVFITSSFYRNDLPQWVKDFNASGKVESYLKPWNTLKDITTYIESGADKNDFEHRFRGKETATFPYDLNELSEENGGYDILKSTPYGNNISTDFALAAIDGEQLGQDEFTDFLTLSYSSPDYIGHSFGVNSKEVQDNYVRLDEDIARLIKNLDEKVGKGNYTLFLTADHGAVHVPNYLKSKKIPAGYMNSKALKEKVNQFLGEEYGILDLIKNVSNNQIFFDKEMLREKNIKAIDLANHLKGFLIDQPHLYKVYTREEVEAMNSNDKLKHFVENGFHQQRSGDVIFLYDPAFISYSGVGSTHGSSMTYDTHVPLIFYGMGIQKGQTYAKTEITDIAPTISALLGIAFPNAVTGEVIQEVLEKK